MTKTAPYDSAEFLTDEVAIQEYLNEALATNDAALIAHAVGVVARARSMAKVAKQTGLSRGSLYRALSSEGQPELETLLKVLGAVGIILQASGSATRPVRALKKPKAKSLDAAGAVKKIGALQTRKATAKAAKAAKRSRA